MVGGVVDCLPINSSEPLDGTLTGFTSFESVDGSKEIGRSSAPDGMEATGGDIDGPSLTVVSAGITPFDKSSVD